MKRHPRVCRFWREFGRCKFSEYCSYRHKFSAVQEPNAAFESDLHDIKAKLENLENQLREKDNEISELNTRIENLSTNQAAANIAVTQEIIKATNEIIYKSTQEALAPIIANQNISKQNTNDKLDSIERLLAPFLEAVSKTPTTNLYSCNICGQKFEVERTLRNHVRSCHHPDAT